MESSPAPLKIFLADDSVPIRQRVGALLAASEMRIVGEAATPQGCIAGILGARPDVVVLDCRLEGGTGLEVLQTVRRAEPGIAFVVFSNNAIDAYRKRYLAAGATRFLDKSADFDQLAEAVSLASHPVSH